MGFPLNFKNKILRHEMFRDYILQKIIRIIFS